MADVRLQLLKRLRHEPSKTAKRSHSALWRERDGDYSIRYAIDLLYAQEPPTLRYPQEARASSPSASHETGLLSFPQDAAQPLWPYSPRTTPYIRPRITSKQSQIVQVLKTFYACICRSEAGTIEMASLQDLPLELVEEVFIPLSMSDLSRLSRTTRNFHEYLSPRLYKNISFHWGFNASPPPIHLLLRTLLNNPKQASRVRSLRLSSCRAPPGEFKDAWPFEGVDNLDWYIDRHRYYIDDIGDGGCWRPIERTRSISTDPCFAPHDFQTAWRSICMIHRPQPSVWMRELGRGNVDVIVALLLGHLPSLTNLAIGFGYLHHAQFIPAMLRHKMIELPLHANSHFFKSLKEVEFAKDNRKDAISPWTDLDLFRSICFSSTVESFHAGFMEPVLFAWPGVKPSCRSLTTLILSKSGITEDTLAKILSATPVLKNLTYDHVRTTKWGGTWPAIANSNQIRCWRLNRALAHVKCTLQKLIIKIEFFPFMDPLGIPDSSNFAGPSGIAGRLTILKDLGHLKRLEVPWEMLFGWFVSIPTTWSDSLPGSLLDICLRDDSYAMMGYEWSEDVIFSRTVGLLDCYRESFKDLERVHLAYMRPKTHIGAVQNRFDERLLAMFNSRGILFASSQGRKAAIRDIKS